jgi:hypothetical protein
VADYNVMQNQPLLNETRHPIWFTPIARHRRDIEKKTVEFKLSCENGFVAGTGVFLVRGDGVNKMAVDILVPHPAENFDNIYRLPSQLVEQIEEHPNQAVADFRLLA